MASGNWAYKPYDVYVAVVTIRLKGVSVTVINIYNPIGNKNVIIIGRFMELALNKVEREITLLRDFNIYYSMWGGRAAATET